ALAAVGTQGCRNIARAVDRPATNCRAAQSWITLRAALATLALRTSNATLAWARKQLPAGTRAGTWRILKRDKAAAIEGDDIEPLIVGGLIERAAHGDAPAIAAGGCQANPVRVQWRLASIALGLERAAIIGDDVARVVDGLWHPQLDQRQLAGRPLLAPWAWLRCS